MAIYFKNDDFMIFRCLMLSKDKHSVLQYTLEYKWNTRNHKIQNIEIFFRNISWGPWKSPVFKTPLFQTFFFLMCQVGAFRSSFRWYFYFQVLKLYCYLNFAFLVSSLGIIYSWDVKFLKFLSVIDVAIFDCCEHMFKIPCSNFSMLLTTLVTWAITWL